MADSRDETNNLAILYNGKISGVKSSRINPLSSNWAVISILIAYSKTNIRVH